LRHGGPGGALWPPHHSVVFASTRGVVVCVDAVALAVRWRQGRPVDLSAMCPWLTILKQKLFLRAPRFRTPIRPRPPTRWSHGQAPTMSQSVSGRLRSFGPEPSLVLGSGVSLQRRAPLPPAPAGGPGLRGPCPPRRRLHLLRRGGPRGGPPHRRRCFTPHLQDRRGGGVDPVLDTAPT